MKAFSLVAVCVSASFLVAGDERPADPVDQKSPKPPTPELVPPPPTPVKPKPPAGVWLGCDFAKPDPTAIAQLPSLPPGMGLVVRRVFPDSPAEASKIEMMDVIWKFDDQMIVNQSQLATLLNLKNPGDGVSLTVFRAGKSIEVSVKLAAIPPEMAETFERMREWMRFPDEPGGLGEKIVDRGDRTATYKTEHGKAVVKRDGEDYQVTIQDPKGAELLNKKFPADGKWDGIPDGWHRRVWVLRRSLDFALENNNLAPVRPPRPRVVPSPTEAVMPPPAVVSPPGKPASPETPEH
ncbi:MAG: PDZ domain-containing protein [Verrucomicrobia bacterium]|nr:PDZ domain-containing protein [Verrucomicrobiota bacterium]